MTRRLVPEVFKGKAAEWEMTGQVMLKVQLSEVGGHSDSKCQTEQIY